MSNKANAVKMKDNDNVATAVRDLSKGEKGRVKKGIPLALPSLQSLKCAVTPN
ncbi:hypothetical protein GCM10010965_14050 [Caldalkalibacillus thermarum]|uniref:hypothetical protein n=1 Tax=Caldalkalibacillus thermarum TaxID=296745 RepID=UPI0016677FE8|nr:hypothetical protein [Caldalkalibacillus thermarum]GGK22299.1 hypothetical protein GCM10010965_14050 [Caldalkalibacillus thermarum]